jgi:hypothetical protein
MQAAPATGSFDDAMELIASISMCDAQQFQYALQEYRYTRKADSFRALLSILNELAQRMSEDKKEEHKRLLQEKIYRRILIGLRGLMSLGTCCCIPYMAQIDQESTHLQKIMASIVILMFFGSYGVSDVYYAYCAGTEHITKDIEALDEIVTYIDKNYESEE